MCVCVYLCSEQWDSSLEMEAFLEYPFQIKQSIEHKGYLTGAQSLCLHHDLTQGCKSDQPLSVKAHPPSASMADRKRKTETRGASELDEMIVKGRTILAAEVSARFFGERPSNVRMVQAYMCKQVPMAEWADDSWVETAKALYLKMLRNAAAIAGVRSSPPLKSLKSRTEPEVGAGLFRNRSPTVAQQQPQASEEFDAVTDEVQRWAAIEQSAIDEHTDSDGLVNEFALVYKLRTSFPLHFTVFKQVSSHLCHEANTEQLFSVAGNLSDDNGKMNPFSLSVWTSIAANSSVFKPTTEAILKRYMSKFSKNGALHADHCGFADADGEVNAGEDGGYYARYGEPQQDPRGAPDIVPAPATALLAIAGPSSAIAGPSSAPSAAEVSGDEEDS